MHDSKIFGQKILGAKEEHDKQDYRWLGFFNFDGANEYGFELERTGDKKTLEFSYIRLGSDDPCVFTWLAIETAIHNAKPK